MATNVIDETFVCEIPLFQVPEDAVDEERRIAVLIECRLLDSDENELEYDRLTALARRIFNTPICLISLVDSNRQYFKSNLGLAAKETERKISFCGHAILQEFNEQLIVLDTYLDSRFRANPLVTGYPFIRFYAGSQIIIEGCKIGTFCIIDSVPRQEFSLVDKLNLLDLTAAVSNLISQRRAAYLHKSAFEKEKVLDLMQAINTPLTSLACGMSLLSNDNKHPLSLEQVPDVIHGLNASLLDLQQLVRDGLSNMTADSDIAEPSHSNNTNCDHLESDERGIVIDRAVSDDDNIPSPRKIRVLLVEDSIAISKMMSRWLETNDCEVTTAMHGLLGLNELTSHPNNYFDVIITDFLMPVMDGITFISEVNELRHKSDLVMDYKELLIFGMSATAMHEDTQKAFGLGMNGFSKKPVDCLLLRKLVDLKLRRLHVQECVRLLVEEFHCGNQFTVGTKVVPNANAELNTSAIIHQEIHQYQPQTIKINDKHHLFSKEVSIDATTALTMHDSTAVPLDTKIPDTLLSKGASNKHGGLFAHVLNLFSSKSDVSSSTVIAGSN